MKERGKRWEEARLGDLATFRNGINFTKSSRGDAIKVVGVKDFQNSYWAPLDNLDTVTVDGTLPDSDLLREKDILFVRSNGNMELIGRSLLVGALDERITHSGFTIRARLDASDAMPEYVCHFLKSEDARREMIDSGIGTNIKSLNQATLSNLVIPLPPLAEQRRIVGILDEAFEGLATSKANAEQNLQNARALFESHLQAVFTQRGHGWVETTIGESCVLRSGTTLPKEVEKSSGEVPYLKVADMNLAGNLDGVTCSSRYVNRGDVNASNLLPVGTTIFPKRGGAILTNKKRLTTRVICADLNIMGVIPGKTLLSELLYLYFLNVDMRELGSGSSIPQINNYDIEPLSISFPTLLTEQTRIVNELEALSEETQRLESLYQRKLAALDELKKSLLHRAFSGQL